MTLTTNATLRVSKLGASLVAGVIECPLEGTALSLPVVYEGISTDWTYSATAEGRGGETPDTTALPGYSVDMDDAPGLIYSGPSGGQVEIEWANVDIKAVNTPSSPEATDELTVALFLNNKFVGQSDEGFATEFDTATAEFNGTHVLTGLIATDVIRFALITQEGSEDALIAYNSEPGQIVLS